MTPEPAQSGHYDLPGALRSPRDAKDLEAFWADLGRPSETIYWPPGSWFGFQMGCKPSEGVQGGAQNA